MDFTGRPLMGFMEGHAQATGIPARVSVDPARSGGGFCPQPWRCGSAPGLQAGGVIDGGQSLCRILCFVRLHFQLLCSAFPNTAPLEEPAAPRPRPMQPGRATEFNAPPLHSGNWKEVGCPGASKASALGSAASVALVLQASLLPPGF